MVAAEYKVGNNSHDTKMFARASMFTFTFTGHSCALNFVCQGNSSFNASNSCFNPQPDLLPTPIDENGYSVSETQRPLDGALNMGLVNGLLNVSSCKFNAPAYVSFPHFYMADPMLLDMFHPDSGENS